MPFDKPHNVRASVPMLTDGGIGRLMTLLPFPVKGNVVSSCCGVKGKSKVRVYLDGVLCGQHEYHNVT